MDESPDAMVRPGAMKVALLNAAADVRAKIVSVAREGGNLRISFDKDVPQALITEKLRGIAGVTGRPPSGA